ncbi:MAG TPA: DUF3592 domain-containing protein [Terriglobales bacterium]|jgi:hypothetical protein
MEIERHQVTRFVVMFGLVFLMASMFNPPSRASLLMWFSSGKVDGSITREADPSNHNYLSYEYTVLGKTYSGTGYGPYHAGLQRGQSVAVYYFPPAPSESVLVGEEEQRGYAAWGLLSAAIMGAFVGLGDYWNGKRQLRQRSLPMAG